MSKTFYALVLQRIKPSLVRTVRLIFVEIFRVVSEKNGSTCVQ